MGKHNYVTYTMANLSNLPGLPSDTSRDLLQSFRSGSNSKSLRLAENVRKRSQTTPFQLALNYLSNGK